MMMSHEHQVPKIDSLHDEKWSKFIRNKFGNFVIKKTFTGCHSRTKLVEKNVVLKHFK